MQYRALMLDFYGTLVEEDAPILAAIVDRVAANSPEQPQPRDVSRRWWELMGNMVGESYGSAFRLQREIELDSLTQILHEYHVDLPTESLAQPIFNYWQHPRAYPGAAELLRNPALPVCIVSNIDTADLLAALEYRGWRVPLFVTSETCRAYKPRREMFDAALRLLDCSAQEALHVGDSISSDVVGAQRVGVDVAWVNKHHAALPVPAPTFILDGVSGLSALL